MQPTFMKTPTQTKTFKLLALVLSLSLLGACSSSPSAAQPSERQAKAMAMWQERCKTAGEKIYKTVENVEGVYLMKLRLVDANYGDQFKMDDPYGHDLDGAAYLRSFIQGHYSANHIGTPIAGSSSQPKGYPYVEAIDPEDGQRYHYTGRMKVTGRMDATAPNVQIDIKRDPNFDLNIYRFVLERVPASDKPPRYGVTYDDISTHEEREYWIAGSSLKVIDLQTECEHPSRWTHNHV